MKRGSFVEFAGDEGFVDMERLLEISHLKLELMCLSHSHFWSSFANVR